MFWDHPHPLRTSPPCAFHRRPLLEGVWPLSSFALTAALVSLCCIYICVTSLTSKPHEWGPQLFHSLDYMWRVNNVHAPRESEGFPQTLSVITCPPGFHFVRCPLCHQGSHFVGHPVGHFSLNTHQAEKAPFLRPPLPVLVLGPHKAPLTDFISQRNVTLAGLLFLEAWPYKGKHWILLSKAFKSQF